MKKDYRLIKIKGRHGEIDLMVPNQPPTKEEWNELHRVIAEVVCNN